jgi:hypothetical protein
MIIFFVNYPVGVDDIRHYEIFVHFGNLLAKNFVSLLKDKRSLYPTVTNKCRSNFYGQF